MHRSSVPLPHKKAMTNRARLIAPLHSLAQWVE